MLFSLFDDGICVIYRFELDGVGVKMASGIVAVTVGTFDSLLFDKERKDIDVTLIGASILVEFALGLGVGAV